MAGRRPYRRTSRRPSGGRQPPRTRTRDPEHPRLERRRPATTAPVEARPTAHARPAPPWCSAPHRPAGAEGPPPRAPDQEDPSRPPTTKVALAPVTVVASLIAAGPDRARRPRSAFIAS